MESLTPTATLAPAPFRANPAGRRDGLLLGALPELRRDPLSFLTRRAREDGDAAAFRVLGVPVLLLSHPAHVEALLTDKVNFRKGRALAVGRPVFGNGLLTSEGDFWRRQRRLAQPAFHRERIAGYAEVMTRFTERRLAGFRDGDTRDVHEELMALTLEIVAKTLFDADVSREARPVGEAMEVALREFPRLMNPIRRLLFPYVPTRRNRELAEALATLDRVILGIIRSRRTSGVDAGDLLSMYLAARDDDGNGMTDQELRDEVMTLFLAGHETTAIALTWTFHLLSQNPAAATRLDDELRTVLGGRTPAFADVPNLRYADAVVKESMRIFPPVWTMGRLAVNDVEIAGVRVKKGTSVIASQWVIHRDARFFDDPLRFVPERWLDERAKSVPRFAYFPFGGGPRSCIGASFASMEAVLILATVAQRFRMEPVPGHPVEPWPSITLRPRHGLRMTLHRR